MTYQLSCPQPGYYGQPTQFNYPGCWQAPSPRFPSQPPAPGYPEQHHQFSFAPPPGPPPSHGAPPPQAPAGASNIPTTDQFEGVQFRIDHRDSNSVLYLHLQPGAEVKAKPGSMLAMDATVKIKGSMKFSVKKLLLGGNMSQSTFTGPGEVLIAPETWGDIVPIHLDGHTQWSVKKDVYLACTMGVTHKTKSQGVEKALFSGEGLSVYNLIGAGIMWVTSLGAICSRTLQPGEQWIVDNGHLVAWTATYKVEKIEAGGFFSSLNTEEGFVCRFTGPGIVYIQTRNPETLGGWIKDQVFPPDLVHSAGRLVSKTLVPGS